MVIPVGQALLLGVVEGLTEFLPVSSTGHLILTTALFGLRDEAVKTFEIVIQSGAIVAVLGVYRERVQAMWQGLWGKNRDGQRLFGRVLVSVLPALVAGAALHQQIQERLFAPWTVISALAVGGVGMIIVDRWQAHLAHRPAGQVESLTGRQALLIGLAQCLALWPGTSRAMVTIVAGVGVGLSATAAAEYSFLLAVPTLAAATLFDALHGGRQLLAQVGWSAILVGFLSAAVVAAMAVQGFIGYLTRHGLAPFGWYRVALSLVMAWVLLRL